MGKSLRVIADYDRFKSHGRCVAAAPRVFAVRSVGPMHIQLETIDDSLRESCETSVDSCPEQTLTIQG